MSVDTEKLQDARWALEKNLGWIAASDAKAGFMAAALTAMLATLAIAFNEHGSPRSDWAILCTATACLLLGGSVILVALSVLPQLKGPEHPTMSYFFFGDVSKESCADFVARFLHAGSSSMLEDCLVQVHRNAQIAKRKFDLVRGALLAAFLGVLPWMAAIGALSK